MKRTKTDVTDLVVSTGDEVVQKTAALSALSQTALSLPELKIVDVYLSKINSHDDSNRVVKISKKELETCLRVTKIPRPELEKRLVNLFKVVKIDYDKCKELLRGKKVVVKQEIFTLFEKAVYMENEDGFYEITLACSADAAKHIFRPENIGYIKYRLNAIINLTSRYSYVMFIYLENQKYRKKWQVSVEELKHILCCEGDSYDDYRRFNEKVLKKVKAELEEKMGCKFDYRPIRKNRKVTDLEITINNVETFEPVETLPLPCPDSREKEFKEMVEKNGNPFENDERVGDTTVGELLSSVPDALLSEEERHFKYTEQTVGKNRVFGEIDETFFNDDNFI